jgi:hypothetical protein
MIHGIKQWQQFCYLRLLFKENVAVKIFSLRYPLLLNIFGKSARKILKIPVRNIIKIVRILDFRFPIPVLRKIEEVGVVVAQLWGCGGSVVGLWWLSFGVVVAQFRVVVAQLRGCGGSAIKAPDCYAEVPGSIPASPTAS